ncbi:MAG: o-succinylbenzoate synthase [Gemmatimonadales bacterium]
MRVERAVLRELELELRAPFRTAGGTLSARRVLLVTLEAEGLEGWAECVAGVDASSPETVDGAWSALTDHLLGGAVGRRFERPDQLVAQLRASDRAPMARAAVEMAAWDLCARGEGASLSEKLGGVRDMVPVGVAIGLQDTDDMLLDVVAAHLAEGYARVKLKIVPGRDVDMLAAVRARFPDAVLWADANAAYTPDDTARLRLLDDFDLGLIEQPLAVDDFAGHAALQGSLRTPICLDESIRSYEDAERALAMDACRVVNLKPGRLGGLDESVRVHELVGRAGVPAWCGGMLETGIGRAHNLALASLPGFTLPGDISASRRYWERDLVTPEHEVVDGCMRVPAGPGIGVEVDVERVRALTTRKAIFAA